MRTARVPHTLPSTTVILKKRLRHSTLALTRAPLSIFLAVAGLFALSLAPLATEAETIYKYINSKGEVVFTDQPTKGAQKLNIIPPPVIPLTPIDLPPTSTPPPQSARPATEVEANQSSTPLMPSLQMQPPGTDSSAPIDTVRPSAVNPPRQNPINTAPAESMTHAPRIIRQPLPETSTSAIPTEKRNGHYQSLIITEPKAGVVTAHAGGTIFVQAKLTPELDQSAGDRIRIVIDGNIRVDDSTGQRFMISDLSPGTHSITAIVTREGKNIFQSNPVVIHLVQAAGMSAPK